MSYFSAVGMLPTEILCSANEGTISGLMGVQLDGEMFDMGIPEELRKTMFNFSKD